MEYTSIPAAVAKCRAPWTHQAGCRHSAGDGTPDSTTDLSRCIAPTVPGVDCSHRIIDRFDWPGPRISGAIKT